MDRSDAGLGYVAIDGGIFSCMLGNIVEHRAQILDVDEEKASFVGYPEEDVEHPFLCVVETEDS